MEWYEQGFWDVYPHPDTARQYLMIKSQPVDGSRALNTEPDDLSRAITLEQFKETKFDLLIASLPQHIEPLKKLIQLYQPQAKLIFQVGNQWNIELGQKNVMAAAKVHFPVGTNGLVYHEEFNLDLFKYEPVGTSRKIYSFINCLGAVPIYSGDWDLFLQLESLMPDWEFKSFGGICRDGAIPEAEVAKKMKEAAFVFHCKKFGDGMGLGIHEACAMGRPLITRYSDYQDKLAGPLITPNTSILVDNKSPRQISEEIEAAFNSRLQDMSEEINLKFKETVDFDKEQKTIEQFLENLQ